MKSFFYLFTSVVSWSSFATVAVVAAPVTTNSIKFVNHCPYDIWYWIIGPRGSRLEGSDESRTRVPGNDWTTIHPMINTERLHGGIVLKIRDYPQYQVKPAGIIQVEYNFLKTNNLVWYDLSVIDCDHKANHMHPSFCPLVDGGIKMYIPGANPAQCPPAWCSHSRCENVYLKHGSWHNEPSFMCSAGVNILIETCTDRAGPQTFRAEYDMSSNATASGPGVKGNGTASISPMLLGATLGASNSSLNATAPIVAKVLNATASASNMTFDAAISETAIPKVFTAIRG